MRAAWGIRIAVGAAAMGVMIGGLLMAIAASPFAASFTGAPVAPRPLSGDPSSSVLGSFDVQVHNRDDLGSLEAMDAHHGEDCGAPPATHHLAGNYADAVFQCKDHVMTAINSGGYGVIYLTPNVMADWSAGEAVISFDVSTWRASSRDWWDVWVTPYDQNMALPLEAWLPDLNGPPKTALHFSEDQGVICPESYQNFQDVMPGKYAAGNKCNWWTSYDAAGLAQSQSVRTRFEIHISKNHLKVGIPSLNLWWFDADIPGLSFTQGVVQIGHHSYNPTKDCGNSNAPGPDGTCKANTWHWDNISVSPAVPFSIIKADQRAIRSSSEVLTFVTPAPANAFLRFAGVGKIDVSFDGGATWRAAQKQVASKDSAGSARSYWTPMPAGTQRVKFRFSKDDWYSGEYEAHDFSIFASTAGASIGTATGTTSATATTSGTAVATKTATATATATPAPSNSSVTATINSTPRLKTVWRRTNQYITTSLKLSVTASVLVDVEIFGPDGRRVAQIVTSSFSLTKNVTRSSTVRWMVPADAKKGTYTVKVGVFKPGWGTLYGWKEKATTFTVK